MYRKPDEENNIITELTQIRISRESTEAAEIKSQQIKKKHLVKIRKVKKY